MGSTQVRNIAAWTGACHALVDLRFGFASICLSWKTPKDTIVNELEEGTPRPKVFISYSHDSAPHRERVLGLSERLRWDGIETVPALDERT